jgi:pSer/pThr/pTyr-binding forkhead associated (FHA) protein
MEPWTVSVEAPGAPPRPYSLGREETTIGRVGCDICLSDPQVSRRHAALIPAENRLLLRDLNSRNGTFVNGARIAETEIRAGDDIRIGNARLILGGEEHPPTETELPGAEPTRIAIDAAQSELLSGEIDPSDVRELLRAKADLETVYRAGRELSAAESPQRLYDRILDILLREFPAADVCSLHRLGPTGEPTCEAIRRRPERTGDRHPSFSHSVLRTVNLEMKGGLTFDAPTDGRFREHDSIQQLHIRSLMGVPLQSRGRRVGILQASTIEPEHRFYRNDLILLTALGAIAGPVVGKALLLEN